MQDTVHTDAFGVRHVVTDDGDEYRFRAYFPYATGVGLVSDATGWDEPIPLEREVGGVFSLSLTSRVPLLGTNYKYYVTYGTHAEYVPDVCARAFERGGLGASVIADKPLPDPSIGLWNERRYHDLPTHILGICQEMPIDLAVTKAKEGGYTHLLLPSPRTIDRLFAPTEEEDAPERAHRAGVGVYYRAVPPRDLADRTVRALLVDGIADLLASSHADGVIFDEAYASDAGEDAMREVARRVPTSSVLWYERRASDVCFAPPVALDLSPRAKHLVSEMRHDPRLIFDEVQVPRDESFGAYLRALNLFGLSSPHKPSETEIEPITYQTDALFFSRYNIYGDCDIVVAASERFGGRVDFPAWMGNYRRVFDTGVGTDNLPAYLQPIERDGEYRLQLTLPAGAAAVYRKMTDRIDMIL